MYDESKIKDVFMNMSRDDNSNNNLNGEGFNDLFVRDERINKELLFNPSVDKTVSSRDKSNTSSTDEANLDTDTTDNHIVNLDTDITDSHKVNLDTDWSSSKQETRHELVMYYTNADSLLNKRDELGEIVGRIDPDLIAITEVKPKVRSGVMLAEFNIPGYDMFCNSGFEGTGRGTVLLVKSVLKPNPVTELTNNKFVESTWCTIINDKNDKILIGVIYRSPNSSNENNEALLDLIKKADNMRETRHLIMVGDFNLPDLRWNGLDSPREDSFESKFCETLNDHFLHQLITEPTRFRDRQQPNVLDLIITDTDEMVKNIMIQEPLGKSDHESILFHIAIRRAKPVVKERFQYKKADFQELRTGLEQVDWEKRFAGRRVEENWVTFTEVMEELVKKSVPKVTVRENRKLKQPWVNKETIQQIKEKKKAYRRYRKTRKEEDLFKYKEARNNATKKLKSDKREYEQKIAEESKTNSKAFWNYVNSKTKYREGICELERGDGTVAQDDIEKANTLNSFFTSVFTVEDLESLPSAQAATVNSQMQIQITEDMVFKELDKLNANKSPGPDGIHPFILKNVSKELSVPLNSIFNQSLREGRVPEDWKKANVTAIHKKGDKKIPGNYRPVSLTSIVCKLMEQFVKKSIVQHMTENNLFCDEQHGFLGGRSCVTNLLETIDVWTEILDRKEAVDVLYLDFRKAFDKVPHKRLIVKLGMYGIHQETVRWVEDFLTERQQRVIVNSKASDWSKVTSGIPQGSVLGPILFLVYINDLPEELTSDSSIFADDTKVFTEVNDENNISLQEDIDKLQQWTNKWQLEFNIDKCAVLHLGSKNPQHTYKMTVNGKDHTLKSSQQEKDLGVLIDDKLNFKAHVHATTQKANRTLGLIKRNFKYLPEKQYIGLYKSQVRTKLEYANAVWSPLLEGEKDKIERVQRRASKQVKRLRDIPYCHRLKELHLPTLDYRRKRGDLIQTYKILHEKDKVKQLFHMNTSTKTRGHSLKLNKNRNLTRLRHHFFSNRVVNTWNTLPEEVVSTTSINSFKNGVDRQFRNEMYTYDKWM